jgi:serine/threonine protein kinase
VEGGTLRTLLKDQKLSPNESASIVLDVAKCIQTAHDQGVLHRDLKPANILLQPRPVLAAQKREADQYPSRWIPKVTDFGLAASIDSLLTEMESLNIQGTPFYMAPEQLHGSSKTIGPASDIYALGVILYELLAGRVPFAGQDLLKLKEMVLHQQPIAPRSIQTGVPLDLQTICLKCLEKDPRQRYSTAAELADDLERFLQKRPILARPVGPIGKTWRWARRNPTTAFFASLSIFSLTLLVAGSILFAFNQNRLREKSEELKLIAQVNERLANKRFEEIRDKFFRELEISSSGFDELRTIVNTGIAPDKIKSYYDKVIEQRFERAIEMTQRPDLLQVDSESMVEAFYLAGLKQQTTDQNLAMPLFQTAVNRAKAIQAKRQLNPLGRFCALNSDNYLGVFQDQRKNTAGALSYYQDGWNHFRLKDSESLNDPRLKKFTLLIGKNLVGALKATGQHEQAALILKACEPIEKSQVIMN